jgi:hypothetical protein
VLLNDACEALCALALVTTDDNDWGTKDDANDTDIGPLRFGPGAYERDRVCGTHVAYARSVAASGDMPTILPAWHST